ncbi:MAG: glycosyltransferase [Candidatus Nealsonbacteria bacterium]|nr:glycosyltransferase [Candidatus Nealsonbacteria bacterium]
MSVIEIALCITDLEIGGAERCVTELATRLDRRRFRPVVYCLAPRPASIQASCVRLLESADVAVHCLGARHSWQFPAIVRRLTRLLAAQKPHLAQTFLFHANIVGRIAARRAGVPRVVSGIRVAERRRWHLRIDRLTERMVDRHVCVSRSVARFAQQRMGLPAEKLVVIPNGVDTDRYPAEKRADLRQLGIGPDRCVVTFAGRLDRQKGPQWLIDSAPDWLSRLPECDLLLVGEGPLRAKLERACRRHGICDRVHFAGHRDDMPEILAASDLLVLPSAWEGMPNVVLEAMAAGLPVVATDVEGLRELLGPAADQQTVPYGRSKALADRIVELITTPLAATRLGAENQARAREMFQLQQMVTAYEDLWQELVD